MRKKKFLRFYLSILISFSLSSSCTTSVDKKVEQVLVLAGNNKTELEEVINHYSRFKKDSLKLKGAKFLIANMYLHGNQLVEIHDTTTRLITFNPTKYANKTAIENARDSIINNCRIISSIFYDCRELNAKYLINNIDDAFHSWERSEWKDQIPFSLFCEFLLPYRIKNEPISEWRKLLFNKYKYILDSIPKEPSVIQLCASLNKELAKDIKFSPAMEYQLNLHHIPDLISLGNAQCDDLATYGSCVMRSFNIPATIDYTLWAKSNNGHAWCVIFDENSKAWSFQTGEQQPGEHKKIFTETGKEYRTLSKVFRVKYSYQPNTLVSLVSNLDEIPEFLRIQNSIDVTEEYTKAFNIEVELTSMTNRQKIAYICIFNMGEWKPIFWGEIRNSKATFKNMGSRVIYVAGYYVNGKIEIASNVFTINEFGHLQFLKSSDGVTNLKLFKQDINKSRLPFKKEHTLYAWQNDDWIQQDRSYTEPDSSITFNNVQSAVIYKLEANSRIFTIENNVPVWW